MSDTAKRISDGSFKNTIKMTLTTEGHLGVGNIDPKFTVTSAGLVQGRSSISILPLVAGVGLTGKGMNIGLGTWNGDVHTLIGQVTSDGSNNGCIQVTAGGAPGGIGFGGTAYGLSLQPSGGNVGIGMTQATSRLQVNGNIRTDVDFVTKTDTPGWAYVFTPESWYRAISNSGATGSCGIQWESTPSRNPFDRAHISYKVIGRTCLLQWNFSTAGSGFGLNTYGYYCLLPPEFQVGGIYSIKNYYNPPPSPTGTIGATSSDSIGWVNTTGNRYAMSFSLRRSTTGPWPNQWFMVIETMYKNGSGTPGAYGPDHYQNATFRFQTAFEID